MNTAKDFMNAPEGATATHKTTGFRAMKIDRLGVRWRVQDGFYVGPKEMAKQGFTLDPPTPTTAREALDLAWELAHEVKEGQVIPKGTRYLRLRDSETHAYSATGDILIYGVSDQVRTLEPLPDPTPDWLDAPAVLARLDEWDGGERKVFVPVGTPNRWSANSDDFTFHWNVHWSELENVTPLCPKEETK